MENKYCLRLVDYYVSDTVQVLHYPQNSYRWESDTPSFIPLQLVVLKFKIHHKVYIFEVENNSYLIALLQFLTEKAVRPVRMNYPSAYEVLYLLKETKMDIELKELLNFMSNAIRSKRIYELKK